VAWGPGASDDCELMLNSCACRCPHAAGASRPPPWHRKAYEIVIATAASRFTDLVLGSRLSSRDLSHASYDSTSETSFLIMDVFCDSVATSISLTWN
jgi:hypothetical protein